MNPGSRIIEGSGSSRRENGVWIAQSTPPSLSPIEQAYREFQDAYTYFNQRLFDATLPNCLITMQRHAGSYGYFCRQRFVNPRQEHADEIALNPSHFAERTETGVLSTLVHEMCHLWRFHHGTHRRSNGKEVRPGYHDRERANRMIAVGLYPSDTGEPGGRKTGYHMTHYIVEHGPFDVACRELLAAGFCLSWLENPELFGARPPVTTTPEPARTNSSNRWKYTCPNCGLNAWAKPDASLVCGFCSVETKHVSMAPKKPS